MIIGHGVDILDKNRFNNLLKKYPIRFIEKYFKYDGLNIKDHDISSNNFTAKEAFSKALGLGFRYPCFPNHICIKRDDLGKPSIYLKDELKKYIIEKHNNYVIHLSISDTFNHSISSVIIEQI